MKVLFNCSTNIVGGAVKNSAFFIVESQKYNNIQWVYALSPQVHEILDKWGVEIKNFHLFLDSPSKNKEARIKLRALVQIENIDLVYTMAGPAYVKFDRFHLLGISNPYITHADWFSFTMGKNIPQLIRFILHTLYQIYYALRADSWVFQTEESRMGWVKRFFIKKNSTYVVANSIGNELIREFEEVKPTNIDKSRIIRIFCPAAGYIHKGLQYIPDISRSLKQLAKTDYTFQFILTINQTSDLWEYIYDKCLKNGVEECVVNIGAYNYTQVGNLLRNSDIVFVPSFLETFSASYLEAFVSKKNLVVNSKGFAQDICKDGAIYVKPEKSESTAKDIHKLINNKDTQIRLIKNGLEIVKSYGTQKNRVKRIMKIITDYEDRA